MRACPNNITEQLSHGGEEWGGEWEEGRRGGRSEVRMAVEVEASWKRGLGGKFEDMRVQVTQERRRGGGGGGGGVGERKSGSFVERQWTECSEGREEGKVEEERQLKRNMEIK